MIIADTGFWVALFDSRDKHHQTARKCLVALNEPFISTLPVVTEVCYLLQTRCHAQKAIDFLNAQQAGLFRLFTIENQHLPRMAKLMKQYADLPMDLADASLVLLAEELGHGRVVSTDRRDFHTYRWKNQHPFTNLLDD
jgi:predicted nucleic acid-binding protein